MFFRKNRIPPPLDPVIPEREVDPYELQLPYDLAEQPRVFLYFLANNTTIDEDGKALIREWLEKYDIALSEYVLENYGFWGWMAANHIASEVSALFLTAARGAVNEAEQDFFDFLQKDIDGEGL